MSDHDEHDHDDEKHEKHHRQKGEIVQLTEPKAGEALKPGGVLALMERAKDVMTVKRVYGDPIEKNGVTIIPAANVRGGGGGGSGEGPESQGRGWGGGFGVSAGPAGVYVIAADGTVKWRPAVDVNRAAMMGQLVAIVFFLTVRSVVKALAKRK